MTIKTTLLNDIETKTLTETLSKIGYDESIPLFSVNFQYEGIINGLKVYSFGWSISDKSLLTITKSELMQVRSLLKKGKIDNIKLVIPTAKVIQSSSLNNFRQSVSSGVTLVDFYAEWCQPCMMKMKPTLAQMTADNNIIAINVDDSSVNGLAQICWVRSIPMLVVFKDGKIQLNGDRSEDIFNSDGSLRMELSIDGSFQTNVTKIIGTKELEELEDIVKKYE